MSSHEHSPKRSIPEAIHHLDGLDDAVIKMQALEEMGYPISLEPVDPFDYFANNTFEPIELWMWGAYKDWVQPVIHEPGFKKWMHLQISPGEVGNINMIYAISAHPITFLSNVSEGNPVHIQERLRLHLNDESANQRDVLQAYDPELVIPPLLEKMFLAAFDRAEFMRETGHPLFSENSESPGVAAAVLAALADCADFRDKLLVDGQTPVTNKQLKVVARDFITMLEIISDDFKSFKKAGDDLLYP